MCCTLKIKEKRIVSGQELKLIDFKGMSTRLGLFYDKKLRNHVHILCSCLRDFFTWMNKLNRFIWPIDGALTVELGIIAMKGYSTFPRNGASTSDAV